MASFVPKGAAKRQPSARTQPPPPIEVVRGIDEAEDEWEVEKILGSRVRKQRGEFAAGTKRREWVEHLIRWKGCDEDTWEHQNNVTGAIDTVAKFFNANLASTFESWIDRGRNMFIF